MGLTRIVKVFFPELVQETVLVPLKELTVETDLSEHPQIEDLDTSSVDEANRILQTLNEDKEDNVADSISNEIQHSDPDEFANAIKVMGKDKLMKAIESKIHTRAEVAVGDLGLDVPKETSLEDAFDAFGNLEDHIHTALGSENTEDFNNVLQDFSPDGMVSQAFGKLVDTDDEIEVGQDESDYDAAVKLFGKEGLEKIQDQIALEAEEKKAAVESEQVE